MITVEEMESAASRHANLRERIESYLKGLPKENLERIAADALEYLCSIEHAVINDADQVTWPSCGDVIGGE